MSDALAIVGTFKDAEEGGFTLDARDSGCWTGGAVGVGRLIGCNRGVSAAVLIAWLHPADPSTITSDTMRNLSADTSEAIFAAQYYNVVRGDDMPVAIAIMVSDFAYNAGTSTAAKCLQRVLGFTGNDVDGWVGKATLASLAAYDPSHVTMLAADTTRALQVALGMSGEDVDGYFGQITRAALLDNAHARNLAIVAQLADAQEAYYRSLTNLFLIYGSDWIGRTQRRFALSLAHVAD